MKITVIGSTGMIGSRIVAEAAQRGHEVTAVSAIGLTMQCSEPCHRVTVAIVASCGPRRWVATRRARHPFSNHHPARDCDGNLI
jgi:nucleoside-diphosphate-sugar epimerase